MLRVLNHAARSQSPSGVSVFILESSGSSRNDFCASEVKVDGSVVEVCSASLLLFMSDMSYE